MNIRSFSSLYNFFLISRGLYSFSSLSTTANSLVSVKTSKPFIYDYVIERCGLSETEAIRACKILPNISSPGRPDAVLSILCRFGFTRAHIRDVVRICPPILVANVEKYLVPQLEFLEGLGLDGEDLVVIVSRNPKLLISNLDQRLIPGVEYLKRSFSLQNKDVIQILKACKWFFFKDPSKRLLPNIAFFKSHGIVGTQLTMLLKRHPTLLVTSKSKLLELTNKVTEMGLPTESRMFVYALLTIQSMNPETLQQKLDLLRGYGFSENDLKIMFRKAPSLFRTSKEKLSRGMKFYLEEIEIDRSTLIHSPICLMHSIEKRVIPRIRVLQILRSKNLLKKDPTLPYVLNLTDLDFVKYILKYEDEADELLMAYKGESLQFAAETKMCPMTDLVQANV